MNETTGRCLCGTVKYRVKNKIKETSACHCEMCRRWASGPFFGTSMIDEITFSGEDNITHYRSSNWAERAFCKVCGSSLYFRMIEAGQLFLATGTLDDQSEIVMNREVFIDEKPDYYSFSGDAKKMTGKEMFDMYTPTDEN